MHLITIEKNNKDDSQKQIFELKEKINTILIAEKNLIVNLTNLLLLI